MSTRRNFLIGGTSFVLAADLQAAFGQPAASATTYRPPAASAEPLKGLRFNDAKEVGKKYLERFKRWDWAPAARNDPNRCRALLELRNGDGKTAIYWDSKMALDADGAAEEIRCQSSGSSKDTTLKFKGGAPVDALVVPYFVVPTTDKAQKHADIYPKGPWENSGGSFVKDLGLRGGNLGVVIFNNKVAGVIFADEGQP